MAPELECHHHSSASSLTTGRRHGWNADGWAYGTSGYATVAWFALILITLA